jgi:hypothetical protein
MTDMTLSEALDQAADILSDVSDEAVTKNGLCTEPGFELAATDDGSVRVRYLVTHDAQAGLRSGEIVPSSVTEERKYRIDAYADALREHGWTVTFRGRNALDRPVHLLATPPTTR